METQLELVRTRHIDMVVAIDMTVLLVLVLDELHHRRRHKHVAQMTGVVRLVVVRRQLLLRRIVLESRKGRTRT